MSWQYILLPSSIITGLLAGTLLIVYFTPKHLIYWFLKVQRSRSGMVTKYIGDENFIYCYGERGRKQKNESTIVLVHGFTASKDQWLSMFQKLPSHLHLIAIDLPGHGGTSDPKPDDKQGLMYHVDHLYQFIKMTDLHKEPFHLIGGSLGGAIAGMFAAEHPECIEKLTLVCPAMKTPHHSPFTKAVEDAISKGIDNIQIEDCSLLPITPEGVQDMLNSCLYHKQQINKVVLKGLLGIREPKNMLHFDLFKALASEQSTTILEDIAPRIKTLTQIVWGRHDQVIDVSGAEILQKLLPNCKRVDIIEKCGHSILLDRPGSMAKFAMAFRDEYPTKKQE